MLALVNSGGQNEAPQPEVLTAFTVTQSWSKTSSPYKDPSHTRLGPTLVTSLLP